MASAGKDVIRVYTHAIDGTVFYVGCGGGLRPYNFSARSAAWRKCADGGIQRIEVVIVSRHRKREAALRVERALIRRLAPTGQLANKNGCKAPRSKRRAKRGRPKLPAARKLNGRIVARCTRSQELAVAAAARAAGVSRSAYVLARVLGAGAAGAGE